MTLISATSRKKNLLTNISINVRRFWIRFIAKFTDRMLSLPYIERNWLKRGDVNRKNKIILKKFKEQDKKIFEMEDNSKEKVDKIEKIPQIKHINRNLDENLIKAAEIKYFVDNMFKDEKDIKEDFNPENYRKCPECFSIIETKHDNCPYCGSSRIN